MSSLRDQMLNSLAEDEKRKTSLGVPKLTPLQSEVGPDESESLLGALGEGLGAFIKHGLSSASLGLTEAAGLETKDWEEKNTAERIGASIGEVAGMVAPFGAFGLFSKGLGKAAGALSRQGTKQVIRKVGSNVGKDAVGKGLAKTAEKSVVSALEKAALTDTGEAALKQFTLGAKYADDVTELIGTHARTNVIAALKSQGIGASDDMVNSIVNGFKQGIRDGKHINTVERWIEEASGITSMAQGFKKTVARYLAMSAAETTTLALYNTMAGASYSVIKDQQFGASELATSLKHAAYLGFAFPLARGVGIGGGEVTMRHGWNRLWKGFKGANYAAMASKKGGGDTLRGFLKTLTGSSERNLLAGMEWKVGGKAFNIADAKAIDSMTGKEAAEVLNQMRGFILKDGMKIWGKEWAADMVKSSGRMTLGAIVNNVDMFRDPETGEYTDGWKRYPKSEFMTHMMIGAFFTRTRGAWNHGAQPKTGLKDHYKVASLLGIDTAGMEARISAAGAYDLQSYYGAGLHANPSTLKIYDSIEARRAEIKAREEAGESRVELDVFNERELVDVAETHYLMDIAKAENKFDHKPLDLRYLSKESRRELIEELGGIELTKNNKGESVYLKDIDHTQRQDIINIQMGEGGVLRYKEFLSRLNEIGLEVVVQKDGQMSVPVLSSVEGSDIAYQKIGSLIDRFESLGLLVKDSSRAFDYVETFKGNKGALNKKKLDQIITEFKDQMMKDIYGEGAEIVDFDIFDNPAILGSIEHMQMTRAFSTLYDISMGNNTQLSEKAKNVLDVLSLAFTEGGKTIGDAFKQIKPYVDRKGERESLDINNEEDMRIFSEFIQIGKLYTSGKGNKSYETSKEIDIATIKDVVNQFKQAGLGLPESTVMDPRFVEGFQEYKIRRLHGKYVAPEKIAITMELMENGEFLLDSESKRIQLTEPAAKKQEMIDAGFTAEEASRGMREWKEVLDFVGYGDGQIVHVPKITVSSFLEGEPNRLDSPKSIHDIYMTLPKQMSKIINGSLRKSLEKLNYYDEAGEKRYERNEIYTIEQEMMATLENFSQSGEGLDRMALLMRRLESKVSKDDKPLLFGLQNALTKAIKNQKSSKDAAMEAVELPDGEVMMVGEAFRYLISSDIYGAQAVQQYLAKIINMGNSIPNRMDAYKAYMSLKRALSKELDLGQETTLEVRDLIERYNSTRSFKDFHRVIDAATKALASNSIMESPKEYDDNLANGFKAFMDRYSYKSPKQTFQAIAEKYNLKDDFGKIIEPEIAHNLSQALEKRDWVGLEAEMQRIVTNHIQRASTDPVEVDRLINDFAEKDIYKLLDFVAGQTMRNTAKFVNGQIEFKTDNPLSRGNRDSFMERAAEMEIEKLYELDNTAIENLTYKDLSQIDLKAAMKKTIASLERSNELMDTLAKGEVVDETEIWFNSALHPDPRRSIVVQVSEGAPFLFEASPNNLKKLGIWFASWRQLKLNNLRTRINNAPNVEVRKDLENIRDNFERSTEGLGAQATTRNNASVKLRAIYWDSAFSSIFERRFISEVHNNETARQALDDNFYKRIKLYEGGNMHPFNESLLGFMENFNDDYRVIAAAQKFRNNGVRITSVADEAEGSPFLVKDSHVEQLEARLKKEKDPIVRADLKADIAETKELIEDGRLSSLDSSSKNAASYISEDLARVLAARNGEIFDPSKVNGWKPIGYHTDSATGTTMAMKTWFVFSPIKAKMLADRGIDVLTFESATKVWDGISNSGQALEHINVGNRKTWESEISSALSGDPNRYSLNVPISAFSVGTQNHRDQGVTKMHSLMNLANERSVKDLMKWQRIDAILDGIGEHSNNLHVHAREEIARGLYEYRNEVEGVSQISEVQTLAEGLLNIGMRTDNVIIKDIISRAFMSKTINLLRKPQDRDGTSSYLITDDIGIELNNPTFGRLEIKGEGAGAGLKNTRIQLQLGDIAQSHDWGQKTVRSISQARFVVREQGVDLVIGFKETQKGLKLEVINQYEIVSENLDPNAMLRGETSRRNIDVNKVKAKINPILTKIRDAINSSEISTFEGIHNALKFGRGITLTMPEGRYVQQNNMAVAVNTVAIPRKSLDVVTNRVRHILDPKYGNHVITNEYEVAVTHQRDFDMDHMYSYSNMPIEYMRHSMDMAGLIRDYAKYDREPVGVNPFRQDSAADNAMGTFEGMDGLAEYKKVRQEKKMAIGTFIGMNQPLTTLSNLGLSMTIAGKNVQMQYVLNRENMEKMLAMIERSGDMTQNNVDPFGGNPKIFEMIKSPEDFVLFGDISDLGAKSHKGEYSARDKADYTPAFKVDNYLLNQAGREVSKDMAKEVVQIVKGAQSLFNDVYTDGVQRKLTPEDIHFRNKQLSRLFGADRNQYVFMRLFNKYSQGWKQDGSKLVELVKIFYGAKDGKSTAYGMYAADMVNKITRDLKSGKFYGRRVNDVINFKYTSEESETMFNSFPAGRIIKRMAENKMYREDNTAGFRQGKTKDEALGLAKNLVDSITMLRMLGVGNESIYNDVAEGDVMHTLKDTLGKDLFKHEKRSIAYTYLGNRFRQTMRNLDYQKSVNKNKDSFIISELTEELASISVAMQAVETASMRSLGENIGDLGAKIKPFAVATRTRMYPNTSYKDIHVYRMPLNMEITPETVSSMEFGDPRGLKFDSSILPGQSQALKPGYQYLILENPLVARYMTDPNVKNGYAWFLSTRDMHYDNFISPSQRNEFVDNLVTLKEQISFNFNQRMKAAADAPVFSKDIHGLGAIEEASLLSNFFKKWASESTGIRDLGENILDLDIFEGAPLRDDMIKNIALTLLTPDSVPRAYVRGEGQNKLPHFHVNKRLQKALFSWLEKNGHLDLISDRIKLHSDMYTWADLGLNPREINLLDRSTIIYAKDYEGEFARFGDQTDFAMSIMADKFNITGRTMANVLASEGVTRKVGSRHSEVFGGQHGNTNINTSIVKSFEPGDTRKIKRIEYDC